MLNRQEAAGYKRTRFAGLAGAALMHGVLLGWMLSHHNEATALALAPVISVSLITPPEIKPPAPAPQPEPVARPQPKVQPPRPKATPIISTPAAAPSTFEVAAPQPEPPPPAPATVARAPQAEPYVAPIFDAAYLQNPQPPYPDLSRRRNEEGKVVLKVLISADGQAEQIVVGKSSGFERLDRAALETVKKWKFAPARRGNTPVADWWEVPIKFSLENT